MEVISFSMRDRFGEMTMTQIVLNEDQARLLTISDEPFEVRDSQGTLLGFIQLAIAALVGVGVGAAYDGTAVAIMATLTLVGAATLLALATVLRGRLA